MKKINFSLKSKVITTLVLSLCLTSASAGSVFASAENPKASVVQVQASSTENALLEKQQEIDKYVFETNAKEIADKGFTVTHTGQIKDYVEVGISPYSEANAEYLYKIFGKDKVKVVEGQQAQLMSGEVKTVSAPAVTTSAPVKEEIPQNPASTVIYSAAAIAVIGAAVVVINRKKAVK